MKYFGINAVAHELQVDPSAIRRWEEWGLDSSRTCADG